MNVNEFAKYVLDNLGRASLANSLNIANKLYDGVYDIKEFINCLLIVIDEYMKSFKFDTKFACILIAIISSYEKQVNSEITYNKRMLCDGFIIDLWEAFYNRA